MKKELISIIIPVYNVNVLDFEQCIKSILNQSYKNIEIIIVDDGSKNEIANFCDQLEKRDNRIKIYHKENSGVSDSRNYGVKKANGLYFCFIDSDDIVKCNMISLLYNNIKETQADISACGYSYIELDGKEYEKYGTNKKIEFDKNNSLYSFFDDDSFGVSVWNKMFSKEVINKIFFDKEISINEDRLYLFQAIMISEKFVYEDCCLYQYIKRKNSATTKKFNKKRFDVLKVNDYINKEISNNYKNDKKMIILSQKNEVIYLLRLIREIKMTKNKKRYIKEYTLIKNRIIYLSKNKNVSKKLNKFDQTEMTILINLEWLYYPLFKLLTKLNFMKKIKNKIQKRC